MEYPGPIAGTGEVNVPKRDVLVTPSLPETSGSHLLMIKTTDAAGNVGTGDALIQAKD